MFIATTTLNMMPELSFNPRAEFPEENPVGTEGRLEKVEGKPLIVLNWLKAPGVLSSDGVGLPLVVGEENENVGKSVSVSMRDSVSVVSDVVGTSIVFEVVRGGATMWVVVGGGLTVVLRVVTGGGREPPPLVNIQHPDGLSLSEQHTELRIN